MTGAQAMYVSKVRACNPDLTVVTHDKPHGLVIIDVRERLPTRTRSVAVFAVDAHGRFVPQRSVRRA